MGKIDFPAIKAAINIEKMIRFLDLKGKWEGVEFRCVCPQCRPDGKRELALGKNKKGEDAFTCWVSKPQARGDLIYLTAHVKNITQTAAAQLLQDHFMREAEKPTRKTKKPRTKVAAPMPGVVEDQYSIVDHLEQWT